MFLCQGFPGVQIWNTRRRLKRISLPPYLLLGEREEEEDLCRLESVGVFGSSSRAFLPESDFEKKKFSISPCACEVEKEREEDEEEEEVE